MNKDYLQNLIRSREIASILLHDDNLALAFDKRIAECKEHIKEPVHEKPLHEKTTDSLDYEAMMTELEYDDSEIE